MFYFQQQGFIEKCIGKTWNICYDNLKICVRKNEFVKPSIMNTGHRRLSYLNGTNYIIFHLLCLEMIGME